MLGSYGPQPEGWPHSRVFHTEESPSGLLARQGSYDVRSGFVDDDGVVYIGASFAHSYELFPNLISWYIHPLL
jgi:Rho GDP-dissociation inhibitor